ncbi:hypothetical protein, partial [Vibrio parahaemolyticus]|uniref:hypothetical protein n=2 Tax=Vibrio parahaemolyticus TaxID=670 RepID=UPI001E5D4ED2
VNSKSDGAMSSSFYKIKDTLMGIVTFLGISASNIFAFSSEQESDKLRLDLYSDFTDDGVFKQYINEDAIDENTHSSEQYKQCIEKLDEAAVSLSELYNILVEKDDAQHVATFKHNELVEAIMSIDALQGRVYEHMNHTQEVVESSFETNRSVYEELYMLNKRLVRISSDLKDLELLVFDDMLDDDHEEDNSYQV